MTKVRLALLATAATGVLTVAGLAYAANNEAISSSQEATIPHPLIRPIQAQRQLATNSVAAH